jgi:orotate phosphoribosyltransferase
MQTTSLIHSLYQIGAIQFGDFKLKSGQSSSIYINLRKIISYPGMLRAVSDAIWQSARDRDFDIICGVPYAALPIATCLSLEHNLPMLLRRKEKKDYGMKQLIDGDFHEGQHCLVIEDVITTGESILETVAELNAVGLVVNDIAVLIDREQGGIKRLSQYYRVHTVFSLSQILSTLSDSCLLSHSEQHHIEKLLEANTLYA